MVRDRIIHRVDGETWVVWDASIEDPKLEKDLEDAKRRLVVRIGPRAARIGDHPTRKKPSVFRRAYRRLVPGI